MTIKVALHLSDAQTLMKVGKAAQEFKEAVDSDGVVDMNQLVDVFGETEMDYVFVAELLRDALLNAGVLAQSYDGLRINEERLEAFLSSLKAHDA